MTRAHGNVSRRWWQRKPLTPDQALGWLELRHLFIGQCLVLALHLLWMPIWLALPALLAALWRFQQLRARVPRAGILLRLAAVCLVAAGLFLEYGQMLRLEAMIGLLVGIYLLKLLETDSLRDGRVVCGLGFVVLASAFLHDQGPVMAAAAILAAGWLIGGLVLIAGARRSGEALRETCWLMGLSLPLMLGLFVLFPRLPPLWNVPQLEEATTGLTDSVSPGDIAALGRSDELAFRARFDGALPAASERYWRVYTLSLFDGVRWSRASPDRLQSALGGPASRYAVRGRGVDGGSPRHRYELLLEPDPRPWRPSLGAPLSSDQEARYLVDGTLEGMSSLNTRALLKLSSSGQPPLAAPQWMQRLDLLLPEDGNLRARAFARDLMHQAGGDPQGFLRLLFQHFHRQPYHYTLTPPRLEGMNRVDDFLFDSLQGYCTHYASTTVFLARAAGIPARMVAGYLGGEAQGGAASGERELSIRQYDAHAWVEVFHGGRWQRFDPTAAVAPERIAQGALSLQGQPGFMADAGLRAFTLNNSMLRDLRRQWERFEYRWQRSVVGFRLEQQRSLWQRMFGEFRWEWLVWGVLGLLACVVLVGAVLVVWSGREVTTHAGVRAYRRLAKRLGRSGLGPGPGEAPGSHLRRVARLQPENVKELLQLSEVVEQWIYNDDAQEGASHAGGSSSRSMRRQWSALCRKLT
ncbi:DUF3488 and transglutaminase-like domain-containing protein [Cobetia sp. 10Alg 146]|uniref:transglutaminase TgpA family protein n=1 Tax=Cobetia sp. 10Alg 146 TaxID=3040019 RepID=UPI002449FD56|nr:DUF3488 and transglutaminase-like domain-containing protein [Cobetia sp. 10Alg 146]MDH2292906.1 DUF3488 and transglutaminase-like domain-containing protein [Cobetia sp. 10Alg 146]